MFNCTHLYTTLYSWKAKVTVVRNAVGYTFFWYPIIVLSQTWDFRRQFETAKNCDMKIEQMANSVSLLKTNSLFPTFSSLNGLRKHKLNQCGIHFCLCILSPVFAKIILCFHLILFYPEHWANAFYTRCGKNFPLSPMQFLNQKLWEQQIWNNSIKPLGPQVGSQWLNVFLARNSRLVWCRCIMSICKLCFPSLHCLIWFSHWCPWLFLFFRLMSSLSKDETGADDHLCISCNVVIVNILVHRRCFPFFIF